MKNLFITALALSTFMILGANQNVEARSHFNFGLYLGGPAYVAPQPYYYVAPQPYYVEPPYYVEQPYYVAPPPPRCHWIYDSYGYSYRRCR